MDDKSTVDQETQPQQSYLRQACPEYIPLLPTQLHLYCARVYINQMQRQLLWNLWDLTYINNSGATSMTYSYAFTILERHQCPKR